VSEGGLPYPSLQTDQIERMRSQVLQYMARNAHLYLWTTHSHLPDALKVMDAWGFVYKHLITWFKDRMGLGYYFRNHTEFLLFGVRGSLSTRANDLLDYVEERATQHSRKPGAAYTLIERASPGPRLELFARRRRLGWSVWGNEVSSDISLVVPPRRNRKSK